MNFNYLGELILNYKDIRVDIKNIYKNSNNEKQISKIIKRKNNYYLKDKDNNSICKIKQTDEIYTIFIKKDNKWLKLSEGSLKEIFKCLTPNNEKKTVLFSRDQINRLNRGIYRYVESKCSYLSKKDFEAKARFGRIYFDFYIEDIFRVNIYDQDFDNCSLYIKKEKEWEELKNGNFDTVMNFLDKYFKNHYINDEII